MDTRMDDLALQNSAAQRILAQQIRKRQRLFRHKLHRIAWMRECDRHEAWARWCDRKESEEADVRLDSVRRLAAVVGRLLSLKAGLNPPRGGTHRRRPVSDEYRSGGPEGLRGCGQASWENAVRACEEDR